MGDNRMKTQEIHKIVAEQAWNLLISRFSPAEICHSLSFEETMRFANDLFYKNMQDHEIQTYAVALAYAIRDQFQDQWNLDWKNDVFLGYLCSMIWRYDEEYECYKRAYDKLSDPSDILLLLLAGCNKAPGKPPITQQESEFYLKRLFRMFSQTK